MDERKNDDADKRERAEVLPAPRMPTSFTKTQIWRGGVDVVASIEREASRGVVVGRTIIAQGEAHPIDCTQTEIWAGGVMSHGDTDARPQEPPLSAAAAWAASAPVGARTVIMSLDALRPPITDLRATVRTPRTDETQPRITDYNQTNTDRIEIPRLLHLPRLTPRRTLGVAAALCAGALAVSAMGSHGWQAAGKPSASVANATASDGRETRSRAAPDGVHRASSVAPGGVQTTAATGGAAAARSGSARNAAPSVTRTISAETTAFAAHTATPASTVSPRSAVDALIAGKQRLAVMRYQALARNAPDEPAYAAAARILSEAPPL